MVRSRADPTKILTLSVSHAKIEKRNFGDAFYRKGTGKFGRKCCYKRLKDEALNAFTHFFGFVKKASPPTALLRKLVGRGLIQVYERIELS